MENRRNIKRRLVEHFGGKCIWCGYSKSVAALQFHHPNDDKEFGVGDGASRSWEKQFAEAQKCVLICANCHAEEHFRISAERRGLPMREPLTLKKHHAIILA